MKKCWVLTLALVFLAGAALAAEDKEEKNLLKLSKEDLKKEFAEAGEFSAKMQVAYAMMKKGLKEGKKFVLEAFNSSLKDFKGDAAGRLPDSRKENRKYKVESFEDVLLDIKACFALLAQVREKREKIEELKEQLRSLYDKMGRASQGGQTQGSVKMSEEAQQKEKYKKRTESEIRDIQSKFNYIGLARLKKAGKSKDKLISGFAKYAARILQKFLKNT